LIYFFQLLSIASYSTDRLAIYYEPQAAQRTWKAVPPTTWKS